MNKPIKTTIIKELRATVRDKKSLLIMLMTPLFIPIFIFFFSFVYGNISNPDKITTYNIGINYELNEIEKEIIKDYELNINYYNNIEELEKAYDNSEIDMYAIKDENNKFIIYTNESSQDSSMAGYAYTSFLQQYNDYLASDYLKSINANPNLIYNNIEIENKEITGSSDLVDELISIGFMFAIMSITLTATYCATDSAAGEKERGTLETLLTFPIKSSEIIAGKFLAMVISCIITSLISTIFIVVSFMIASNNFEIYENISMNFSIITILTGFIIMSAYSFFISGVCIAIASKCKSYKEAQSALTPITMLTMIPMFMDLLGISLNPIISCIPIINHTMLLKAIFCNSVMGSDIINILIMLLTTLVYTIIILIIISKQYKSEKILFSID